MSEKPLWIPLKTEYFLAFERGEKTVEYRLYGGPWTERTIVPGRPAVLGHGYSGRRLSATVTKLEKHVMDTQIYGTGKLIACIHLQVHGPLAEGAA
ncbi:MAG: hypothetical protein WB823_10945, partial [Steroidobacteraceae bacterium]